MLIESKKIEAALVFSTICNQMPKKKKRFYNGLMAFFLEEHRKLDDAILLHNHSNQGNHSRCDKYFANE